MLDRLLEAAARSPVLIHNAVGEVRVTHEITRTGVKLHGTGPKATRYDLIVPWIELDRAVVDPLTLNLEQIIRGLINAGS